MLLSINMLGWIVAPEMIEEFWQIKPQDDKTKRARDAAARRAQTTRQNPANGKNPAAGNWAQNAAKSSLRQQQNDRGNGAGNNPKNDSLLALSQLIIDEEEIPDSLLHPRWPVQPTTATTYEDMLSRTADLTTPEAVQQKVEYNDSLNFYSIGTKWGDTYLSTPFFMDTQEYMKWSEKQEFGKFFRDKNDEIFQSKGKEKFSFTDMHFDLGPAEKIFGPGGVRVKVQGTAELKLGGTHKSIDNPTLPIRNRNTTSIDFDEKINASVNGSVGDKMKLNLNYNTDATFDFDQQNLKLKYDGKEDEIIKLVEAGNVSFPGNSSLVKGATSLFGLRTDMQFGKLKLQTVLSQKKSSSKSVSSKGGVQLTPFEINAADYEENRHFFLSEYFRDKFDASMRTLPNLTTGVTINRIEVWVTNKSGQTQNTRNIVAFTDLGENITVSNHNWNTTGYPVPANNANTEYSALNSQYADARNIDLVSSTLEPGGQFEGGHDYEKLENARLLNSSEYTVNKALGYVSLKTALQTDQVLAVAYEYTYGGQTFQVGEFASDIQDVKQTLFVKSLKNTSNNPHQGNWKLMMKNVYYLASQVQKEKFRLDVKYQSDTAGVYLTYIPEPNVKETPLIRLLGADRLDNNNRVHANGYFDFIEGYTVQNGRVIFPVAEPFGQAMNKALIDKGLSAEIAEKYTFQALYDSTKTTAKQIAEKNKYQLVGQFRGSSANVISIGAYNIPQGSVVVTAGGVTLKEGSDYSVDYSAGEVTILNQSIIDAGTAVNVSTESQSDYSQMRKTMFGLNWEYDFTKDFQMSGTLQHLSEQALTTKVAMGAEPLNNTLWGLNLNWKKESQWLTNLLNRVPLLHVSQPSNISFTGEFAQLIAGQSSGTQDNASYLDDFENTKSGIDVSSPSTWIMSSVPQMFTRGISQNDLKTTLKSGYERARLAWYTVDPLFTRRSSSLTPAHIKSDVNQLSNHYVREVPVNEVYPNRNQSTYNGSSTNLSILNLAYYPSERGAYNFSTALTPEGKLLSPADKWGGMMRRLDTNDFETANIEYIEFWMLDPFIYSRNESDANKYGGDLYINLGEVSEDVLIDGKKFYESGMPVDGSSAFAVSQWGKIPTQSTVNYAFATQSGTRYLQDVGLNGLRNDEEKDWQEYQTFLDFVKHNVTSTAARDSILADPAGDDYHYFRGSDYDRLETPILRRYKFINNPQGNSSEVEGRTESYDTSYKTTPDVEDINQDFTLNEYERYYQYKVSIRPEDLYEGNKENFITDVREASVPLRNGSKETVKWYQFRIPIRQFESKVGSITDFSSIRFMRMFLTGFEKPIVLRFGSLDLVRGEWRIYEQNLENSANTGTMNATGVNIEENNDKKPVNYVLPPGIRREQDPTQPQLVESNEQAMSINVDKLSTGESKAVYKNTNVDMRQYKRLQMFVHANADENNVTNLRDRELAVFLRLGSDYKNNYYEYEIPLSLTQPGHYDRYSTSDRAEVWPEENLLDIPLTALTALKKERNKAKAQGTASYSQPFTAYDERHPNNKMTVVGNPSLGEVKTMMIGVRNLSAQQKSGEVWVNELRLLEYDNTGGWAAQGNLNVQLSDFGTVNMQGRIINDGFGGIEDGVAARAQDKTKGYTFTTNLELGKFFPDKAKVSMPLYYSVSEEQVRPKYNPLDTDLNLEESLNAMEGHERDSVESIVVTKTKNTNFSLSNVRIGIATKKHPMPYDPQNFTFSYSHSNRHTSGETTVFENENNWKGSLNYSYTPVYKAFEPFKKMKTKSKYADILKRFGLNWLPQTVTFNTDMVRNYYELQERDMEDLGGEGLPLTFNEQFLWNRDFSIRWDLTKNLHASFNSATHAQIEEPYTPINKDLYPDQYTAWKDSVWQSVRNLGTPLDYQQNFQASYQLPLNLMPCFSWLTADASYNATYSWQRGTALEDGTSLGNTIANSRKLNINSQFNLEKLYNLVPFLKQTNERFNKSSRPQKRKTPAEKKAEEMKKKAQKEKDGKDGKDGKDDKDKDAKDKEAQKPKTNAFQKEFTLAPDTFITVRHTKKSKRLIVSGKTEDGKQIALKYKVVDANTIKVSAKLDSARKVMVSIIAKEPLDDKTWYKTAQVIARGLMMVRNVNFTYRNQYNMSLPGFMPNAGDVFGQNNQGALAPGLGFAFGMTDDSFIDKAAERGWLLMNDSVATPAASSRTTDLQLKATVEPVKNFKIDLTASRTDTRAQSVQYMYQGMPTTRTGTFTMTTISIGSAFESTGDISNGFRSASFEKFCNSIDGFRQRVEAQYADATYPRGTAHAGQKFNPEYGGVNQYSADVLVPAFLSSYTSMGGSSLDIFPSLARLLPNWSLRYSGLGQLPLLNEWFKSVNINHAYKSVYAVGSYSSFSTFQEYMNGLGFITDAKTDSPIPNSMYNVSTVSINEAFSPLLGLDVTLQNNLTAKLEYKTTRVLTLSTTSIQINEATSKDWVIGFGYKINNFKLFGSGGGRKAKGGKGKSEDDNNQSSKSKSSSSGFNTDLNLRFDFSLRSQAAITRDIATMTSTASSGNDATKLSFSADYSLSRMMTLNFYYDFQKNTPLLTSSSYPTTTHDFGFSLKFSLTR